MNQKLILIGLITLVLVSGCTINPFNIEINKLGDTLNFKIKYNTELWVVGCKINFISDKGERLDLKLSHDSEYSCISKTHYPKEIHMLQTNYNSILDKEKGKFYISLNVVNKDTRNYDITKSVDWKK